MAQLYRELCNLFIRPAKQQYSLYDLGSPIFEGLGRRRDFDLRNSRGMILKCSFYQPVVKYEGCAVYLHSLNGSRLESAYLAKRFLSLGIAFANFDMSGSGQSQGEYVSLGYHEKFDAKVLIEHLHNTFKIKLFGLWGRSMGAVTALNTSVLFQDKPQIIIACAVLDSPYYSLMQLSLQIADKRIGLPSFLVKAGMMLIKNSIEQKVKFRMQDLQMKEVVKHINTPLLILASQEDQLIDWHHSERIYSQYSSKNKQLFFIKGSHASIRQENVIAKIVSYLEKSLKVVQKRLKRNNSTLGDYQTNRHMVSVKSSQNMFNQSQSPSKRRIRSITPSYIVSRASIKITQKKQDLSHRYKTQKTIYQQQQNIPTASTVEAAEDNHLNIISRKLLKMKPKNQGKQKYSQPKPFNQQSPRRAKGLNIRGLQLKKKPIISPSLLENKLNHNPYLTNDNLVKPSNQQIHQY